MWELAHPVVLCRFPASVSVLFSVVLVLVSLQLHFDIWFSVILNHARWKQLQKLSIPSNSVTLLYLPDWTCLEKCYPQRSRISGRYTCCSQNSLVLKALTQLLILTCYILILHVVLLKVKLFLVVSKYTNPLRAFCLQYLSKRPCWHSLNIQLIIYVMQR